MIKVRLGNKRGADSLRPLTEKEIQQKLYGDYQEEPVLKEKINAEFLDPLRKDPSIRPEPKLKNNAGASLPWKTIGFSFVTLALGIWGVLKKIAQRKTMGWVFLGGAVVSLFLVVNALNLYRTQAMKTPRLLSPVIQPSEALPLASQTGAVPALEVKIPETTERIEEPAPALPVPAEKAFVVQVATYARQTDSERVVKQMIEAGLPSFGKPLRRTGGKVFHLVFLGPFKTFGNAQAELKKFRALPVSQNFPDSFVRSL